MADRLHPRSENALGLHREGWGWQDGGKRAVKVSYRVLAAHWGAARFLISGIPLARTRGSPLRSQSAQQQSHQHSVKTRAAHFDQFVKRLLGRERRRKRLLGDHVGVSVGESDDAFPQRDLFATQPVRVAGAVKALMMMLDGLAHHFGIRYGADNLCTHMGMHAQLKEFI